MCSSVDKLVSLENLINCHLGSFLPNTEDRHEATYELAYILSKGVSDKSEVEVEDLINEHLGSYLVNSIDRHEETYELAYNLVNNK